MHRVLVVRALRVLDGRTSHVGLQPLSAGAPPLHGHAGMQAGVHAEHGANWGPGLRQAPLPVHLPIRAFRLGRLLPECTAYPPYAMLCYAMLCYAMLCC